MFLSEDSQNNHGNMQRKLKELLILSEKLDNNYQKLLDDLSISEDQLINFIDNPENFTENEWNDLQAEKETMEKMLDLQLSQVKDPNENKKKYSQRKRVQSNWIFVR